MNSSPPSKGGDKGAVAIIVAVFAVIMMIMLAFVLDRGRVYVAKTQLQNAVDAAALAGAQEFCGGRIGAEAVAGTYAGNNGVPSPVFQTGAVQRTSWINVAAGERVDLIFGPFAETDQVAVAVQATAQNGCTRAYAYTLFSENELRVNGGGAAPLQVFGGGGYGNTIDFNGTYAGKQFFDGAGVETPNPAPTNRWRECLTTELLCETGTEGIDFINRDNPGPVAPLGSAFAYAQSIGLDGTLNGIPGVIPSLGSEADSDWVEVDAGDCTIDASTYSSYPTAEVLYCGGEATLAGGVPSANLKMIKAESIDVNDTVGDPPACSSNVILYGTAGGSSVILVSGTKKSFCGTIYAPNGEYRTDGNGFHVYAGLVVAGDVRLNGNGETYEGPDGSPFLDQDSVVLIQ